MKKGSLVYRAWCAASTYVSFSRKGGERMWLRGHAAGVRDERKKLHAALREAGLQHERFRKAEHEMNIVRLKNERAAVELRKKYDERFAALVKETTRRVAMLETRLPNGGFSRND